MHQPLQFIEAIQRRWFEFGFPQRLLLPLQRRDLPRRRSFTSNFGARLVPSKSSASSRSICSDSSLSVSESASTAATAAAAGGVEPASTYGDALPASALGIVGAGGSNATSADADAADAKLSQNKLNAAVWCSSGKLSVSWRTCHAGDEGCAVAGAFLGWRSRRCRCCCCCPVHPRC